MRAREEGSVTEHRTRDGRIRFRARLPIHGKRKSLGLYDTWEEAEAALDEALSRFAGEERGVTLLSWGETWLERRETDGLHRSASKDGSCWRTHVEAALFARWPMRRIQRTDVVRWVKQLLRTEAIRARKTAGEVTRRGLGRTIARATALAAFRLLHRALTDAADEGLIPVNPATGVSVPRVPREDDPWTYLTPDEIRDVFRLDLKLERRVVYSAAIYTGLRAGELWGLRWKDVRLDGDRPELHVCKSYQGPTKGGKPRHVPLLGPALAAFKAWKKAKPGLGAALVFPARDRTCHHEGYEAGWATSKRRAGIKRRVRFHDFRHTCGSHLVMGTWTPKPWRLEDVQAFLGHESIKTTERYAHLSPDRLHGLAADERREGKEQKR